MRIYLKTGPRDHHMFVTPGKETGDVSDFLLPDGSPRQFHVRFQGGMADVPAPLGKYLLDKGMAQKTALILPEAIEIETRTRNHRVINGAYHKG